MNAIDMLHDDHLHAKHLLKQLVNTDISDQHAQRGIIDSIEKDLSLHSRIEKEVFYPALREAAKGKADAMQFEALEEHNLIDQALSDLRQSIGSPNMFEGRTKAFKELLEHHIQEEERDMFPLAKDLMDSAQLTALGSRMSIRKSELYSSEPLPPPTAAHKDFDIIGSLGSLEEKARKGVAVMTATHPSEMVGKGVEVAVRGGANLIDQIVSGAKKGLDQAKREPTQKKH